MLQCLPFIAACTAFHLKGVIHHLKVYALRGMGSLQIYTRNFRVGIIIPTDEASQEVVEYKLLVVEADRLIDYLHLC